MRSFSKLAATTKKNKKCVQKSHSAGHSDIGCRDSNSANGGLPTTDDWKSMFFRGLDGSEDEAKLTDFRIPISSEGQYNKPNTRFKIECFESMVFFWSICMFQLLVLGLSLNVNVCVYIYMYVRVCK